MQLRYVFSELGLGLRRNLSMHLAVILTLFVSLTLVGFGVLAKLQADRAAEQWGNELEITVFLCRDASNNPACTGEVSQAEKDAILTVVESNPEVASYRTESKAEAFKKVKALFGPEEFDGAAPPATQADMAESIWITLQDPKSYEGITSAVQGLDGVDNVRDQRDLIGPLLRIMDSMQIGALITAGVLVLAAILLVANTIRLAAFARRKEIAIMRLVGASTLYIALPFLLEALITAITGVALAVGALTLFMSLGVEQRLSEFVGFLPWVGWSEWAVASLVVVMLGPLLTLLPTLVLIRKHLKV